MYKLLCNEDEITYGQRKILDLVDARKIAKFCEERGLNFVYTYKVAIGRYFPPPKLIFALRNLINPVLWFYKENEELPPIKEYPQDNNTEDWDYTKSIGFKSFTQFFETQSIKKWSIQKGFDYCSMLLILSGKRAPSFVRIRAFKDFIPPSDWFFY